MSLKASWSYTNGTAGSVDTNPHAMQAAPPATPLSQQRLYLGSLQVRAGANAGTVTILDGVTVIYADNLAANESRFPNFDPPLRASPGNALNVTCSATAIIVNGQGFIQ